MRVGIIGGGQLARMLALAGIPMGIEFNFLLSKQDSNRCVNGLGNCFWLNKDDETLKQFALGLDAITTESEQVNIQILEKLNQYCDVFPTVNAIRTLQNRILEKQQLQQLGISNAKHFVFHTVAELLKQKHLLAYPFIMKSASDGYDGKNQYRINTEKQLLALANQLKDGDGYVVETLVPFVREISFIAVRSRTGQIHFYAPTENIHCDGILHSSLAPAPKLSSTIINTGHHYLTTLLNHLEYVGVAAMECFEVHDQQGHHLLVNEIAPRVHNSGHWTDAGCHINQFENHLRAILDLPLGSTEHRGFTGMLNVLGKSYEQLPTLGANTTLHWYNKATRPRRKMGHINIHCQTHHDLYAEMLHLYGALHDGSPAPEAILCKAS